MFKRFFSYASYNGLASLVAFLTVPYLTRQLDAESYGYLGLVTSVLFFLVPSLTFSSLGLVSINLVDKSKADYGKFVSQYISLSLVACISLLPLAVLIYIYDVFSVGWVVIALPFICLIQSLGKLHYAELVQLKMVHAYGVYRLLSALLLVGLTVLFLSYTSMDWEGRILAILAAEAVLLIIRFYWTFDSLKQLKFGLRKPFLREVFEYGWPLSILLVASWGINEADRFIVLGMLTLADVGLYTVAYSIGSALNVVNTSMTSAIVPHVFKVMKQKKGKRSLVRLSVFASVLIMLLSVSVAGALYYFGEVIVGENYKDALGISCIITIAFGVNGMYRTLSLPLVYQKLNRLKARNIYIAAGINILSSVILVDFVGVLGPAYGTLLSFIVLYCLTLYYYRKHMTHVAY